MKDKKGKKKKKNVIPEQKIIISKQLSNQYQNHFVHSKQTKHHQSNNSKTYTQTKSTHRKTNSLLSNYPPKIQTQYKYINIKTQNLVTQQDLIYTPEQHSNLPSTKYQYKCKTLRFFKKMSKQDAAILIQKMWRGYQTRKIIKYYVNLYKKKIKQRRSKQIRKQKQRIKNRKKLSDIYSRDESKEQAATAQKVDNRMKNKQQERIFETLKSEQVQRWSEIINIITTRDQKVEQQQILKKLIKISEQNKNKLAEIGQPINLTPIKKQSHQSKVIKQYNREQNPFFKIFSINNQVLQSKYKSQINTLKQRFQNGLLKLSQFQSLSKRINHKLNQSKKQFYQTKLLLIFSIQKAHQTICKLKNDAEYLRKKTGKNIIFRYSVSTQSLFQSLIKNNFSVQSTPTMTPSSSVQQLQKFSKILVQYQQSKDIQNKKKQKQKRESNMKSVQEKMCLNLDNIKQYLQNVLVQQFCEQIFGSDMIFKLMQPYIDAYSTYKFKRLNDENIKIFLQTMVNQYFPSKQQILQKLNKNNNPTPIQLLKLLRQYDVEQQSQNFNFQSVVSDSYFNLYRKRQQLQTLTSNNNIKPYQNTLISPNALSNINKRLSEFQYKKNNILQLQLNLHHMYLKAVFNAFNQYIIQNKYKSCPITNRSTIGSGQLQVSLRNTNISVSSTRATNIIQNAKNSVLNLLKFKCPFMVVSNYKSVQNFQDLLTKQIVFEYNNQQWRWISTYDEILQIGMSLSEDVYEWIIQEAIREIIM